MGEVCTSQAVNYMGSQMDLSGSLCCFPTTGFRFIDSVILEIHGDFAQIRHLQFGPIVRICRSHIGKVKFVYSFISLSVSTSSQDKGTLIIDVNK